MLIGIAILCCIATLSDSVEQVDLPARPTYTKQVIINGLIGVGFTATATICYIKGNSAYDDYLISNSLVDAADNWKKVQTYDTVRNICAVGATLFLARALYYQFKNIKAHRDARITPVFEFDQGYCGKVGFGLEGHF